VGLGKSVAVELGLNVNLSTRENTLVCRAGTVDIPVSVVEVAEDVDGWPIEEGTVLPESPPLFITLYLPPWWRRPLRERVSEVAVHRRWQSIGSGSGLT